MVFFFVCCLIICANLKGTAPTPLILASPLLSIHIYMKFVHQMGFLTAQTARVFLDGPWGPTQNRVAPQSQITVLTQNLKGRFTSSSQSRKSSVLTTLDLIVSIILNARICASVSNTARSYLVTPTQHLQIQKVKLQVEALTDTLKQQAKGMEHLLMRQKQGSSHLEVRMSIVRTEMRFFSQHLLNRY